MYFGSDSFNVARNDFCKFDFAFDTGWDGAKIHSHFDNIELVCDPQPRYFDYWAVFRFIHQASQRIQVWQCC